MSFCFVVLCIKSVTQIILVQIANSLFIYVALNNVFFTYAMHQRVYVYVVYRSVLALIDIIAACDVNRSKFIGPFWF